MNDTEITNILHENEKCLDHEHEWKRETFAGMQGSMGRSFRLVYTCDNPECDAWTTSKPNWDVFVETRTEQLEEKDESGLLSRWR